MSSDDELNRIALYYFFLKWFNVKPWEVDEMDVVLVQGLQEMHSETVRMEQEEAKRSARR